MRNGTWKTQVVRFGRAVAGLLPMFVAVPASLPAQTVLDYGVCVQDTLDSAAQINTYTFTGSKNEIVTIHMTLASGPLDPKIELYDPGGSLVDQAAASRRARIDFQLTSSGTHSIFALDNSGSLTGTYVLCLQRIVGPGHATPLDFGTTISDTVHFPGGIRAYTFATDPHFRVTLQMTVTSGALDPRIELYDPAGAFLMAAASRRTARIDMDLTTGGTFTLLALDGSGTGALTGSYSLNLTRIPITTPVGEEVGGREPHAFFLEQNHPNPFNPATTIRYQLARPAHARLTIYSLTGAEVARVLDRQQPAGEYAARWDGRDARGRRVAGGVYLYRLEAGDFVQTRKMLLVP